ncbi:MAG: methyl-accepting chemotaxis protein [Gammaproteobacteria bacterium]|nr:methyl-accepting chemotaxis protein [Gammaproteobacteria bacterium]
MSLFNQINLQQRLKFLFIFSCLALVATSALGLYGMYASHEAIRTAVAVQKLSSGEASPSSPGQPDAPPGRHQATATFTELQSAYDRRFNWITGVMALAVILLWLIGYLTTRSIAQVAELVRNALKRMAGGDFTVRINYGGGVLKRIISDINSTTERLQSVFSEVSQASTQLAAAATQLSNITDTTEHDIKQQQTKTDQIISAMHEMSSASHAIANNASQAAVAASNADKQALNGVDVVTQAIRVIQGMAGAMENSTTVIHKLQQESTNIGAVLKTINEIADQTNLLALNAAIEAARAGEQGRGFAVVADEVRTLAGRTQQATIEIQHMIERLQAGSKAAVETIEYSNSHVFKGVNQATQASEVLSTITRVVNNITDMNTHIASAAEQQSAVVTEINSNIASIGTISTKNAAAVRHTAQASGALAALAAQLRATLNQLKV